MKRSTAKRIERRLGNLPLYFVDSSVFLEALLKQVNAKLCLSFLYQANYKYRLITSTLVLGEIVKILNKIEERQMKDAAFMFLVDLFEKTEIEMIAINSECITNLGAINILEPHLLTSDCLIFSSAITECSDAFITLDS